MSSHPTPEPKPPINYVFVDYENVHDVNLALIGSNWQFYISQPWFWGKIVLVIGLSGFHGYLMGLGRKISAGERPIEPKKLRMLNEIPMVIAIFAVILVVVQPFG